MKKIVIKNCKNCPYRDSYLCWLDMELDGTLPDEGFPEGCPLEEDICDLILEID